MKEKISFISLGCDKNLVDSEKMLGLLSENGYSFTDDVNEADACIINTCSFINDAKEESIQNILDVAQLKENGKLKALIVTGCLAQRYNDDIKEEKVINLAFVGDERICDGYYYALSFRTLCKYFAKPELLEEPCELKIDDEL